MEKSKNEKEQCVQTDIITRYFFFRDLDNESNLLDGKTFHASGIVKQVFNEKENANGSKDLSVFFLEPFKGTITNAWRTYSEVELFEVSEDEYKQLDSIYNVLYNEL